MSYPLSTSVSASTGTPSALHTVSWISVASAAVLAIRRSVEAPGRNQAHRRSSPPRRRAPAASRPVPRRGHTARPRPRTGASRRSSGSNRRVIAHLPPPDTGHCPWWPPPSTRPRSSRLRQHRAHRRHPLVAGVGPHAGAGRWVLREPVVRRRQDQQHPTRARWQVEVGGRDRHELRDERKLVWIDVRSATRRRGQLWPRVITCSSSSQA